MASISSPSASTAAPVGSAPRHWLRWFSHSAINLGVFGLLAGVWLVGHFTHWQLPSLSSLRGIVTATADDWCVDHSVPESACVECQADLWPNLPEFGFCNVHGVAECVLCNPSLAQTKTPPTPSTYDTAAAIALLPRLENSSRSPLIRKRVQFLSLEAFEKSGVEVKKILAQERTMADLIVAAGELSFAPPRVAHLASRAAGSIARVEKHLGDEVAEGEILALVDAAAVGQAKSQLLTAVVQWQSRQKNMERLRSGGTGVVGRNLVDAQTAVDEAEIGVVAARQTLINLGFALPEGLESQDPKKISDDLRFLGLPTQLASELASQSLTANLIAVRAPHAGKIVESHIVPGEVVDPKDTLLVVADASELWLMLHVRQEDAAAVKIGQPVRFRTDDNLQEAVGNISWISSTIDPRTRTLQVRVSVPNPGHQLRDKTFGVGRIVLREEPHAVVVPRAAVHSTSDGHYIFVRDKQWFDEKAPKLFYARQVRIGARDDEFVELLAGVVPGEVVATTGSTMLLAQLLRANFGAGCGCHEH